MDLQLPLSTAFPLLSERFMLSQARAVAGPDTCLVFLTPRMTRWGWDGSGGACGAFWQGFLCLSLKKSKMGQPVSSVK